MTILLPQGLERPLVFSPGARHVADILASVLVGWPLRIEASAERPLVKVSVEADKILVKHADGAVIREPSAISAVCSLVVEIVDALAAASPALVCLHAAAAEYAGRLLLFPATHRAGKSTLMARLAAGGRRIFADDILPFDLASGEAVATGCLPRLRLPLPRRAPPAFGLHVERNTVASDGYYAYLAAPAGKEVAFGTRSALGAIILLDRRRRRVTARLEPASPDKALLEILIRNTRGDRDAPLLVSTFAAIVGGLPVKRLVYCDLEDAVRCLEEEFAGGYAAPRGEGPGTPATPTATFPAATKIGGAPYRRNALVSLSRVGQSGFLADPRDNAIHVLDAVGLGVWNLLEVPRDAGSLSEIVAGAFPHTPRRRIAADLEALLSTLAGKGLVERCRDER